MKLIAAVTTGLAVLTLLARPRASDRVRPATDADGSVSMRAWLFAAALSGVVLVLVEPVALPFCGIAGMAAMSWRRRKRRRAADTCRRATPDALYALAAELRAGRPIAPALEFSAQCAGPLQRDLVERATSVARGADVAGEFESLAQRRGCERWRAVAAAWRATSPLGASVSGVLERLAESYEQADAADDELTAALAGPRSTVVMLMCLPAVGLMLGTSVGAHPLQLLMHRPVGWALASGAAVLEVAGLAWWRRIVAAALAS